MEESKLTNFRKNKIFKYGVVMFISNLIRFISPMPNTDPIMGSMLPFAKKYNGLSAALFAFLTMITFDLITGMLGIWTLVTATTYGLIGFIFARLLPYFKKINFLTYLTSGIIGVLIFDFITGPLMSTFLFKQGFFTTLMMQIPFTLMHLASVTAFILIITPILDVSIINFDQKNITYKNYFSLKGIKV